MCPFRLSKLAFGALIALVALVPIAGTSQVVTPGNPTPTSQPCQLRPALGDGNNGQINVNCPGTIPWYYANNIGGSPTQCAANGIHTGNGNGTLMTGDPDSNFNQRFIEVYPVPVALPTGTIQPFACAYNKKTGALMGSAQLNGGTSICNGASNHAQPSIIELQAGYFGVEECGANTGATGVWGTAAQSAGTAFPALPFEFGNCIASDCAAPNSFDASTSAHEFSLPVGGLSEGASGTYGNDTLVCGQSNTNNINGIQAGSQACIHLVYMGGTRWTVDTSCSSPNGTVNTGAGGWDFQAGTGGGSGGGGTGLSQVCSAIMGIQWNTPGSFFGYSQLTADVSTNTWSISVPAYSTQAATTCSLTLTGTAATDTTSMITGWNAGTLTGTGCNTVQNFYKALAVGTCGTLSPCTANQTILIEPLKALPFALAIGSNTCSGTSACTWKDTRCDCSGVYNHFEYGFSGVLQAPTGVVVWCNIFDTEMQTFNPQAAYQANGSGFNFFALCARAPGIKPDGTAGTAGVWYFTDPSTIARGGTNHAFLTVSPGNNGTPGVGNVPSAGMLTFNGGSSEGTTCSTSSCTGYQDASGTPGTIIGLVRPCTCTPSANFWPFIYDTSEEHQNTMSAAGTLTTSPNGPAPLLSDYAQWIDNQGNYDIVYACPTAPTSSVTPKQAICWLTIDTTTGNTIQDDVIESAVVANGTGQPNVAAVRAPSGTSVVQLEVSFAWPGCSTFPCFVDYTNANPSTASTVGTGSTPWVKTVETGPSWATASTAAYVTCAGKGNFEGTHIWQTCVPSAGTDGTTPWFPHDTYTGNM